MRTKIIVHSVMRIRKRPTITTYQLGRMQEFEPETESISAYIFGTFATINFFHANDIGKGKKVPILLSLISRNTYALLRNLVAPASPKDKSFKELPEQLTSHFEPKPLVIAERFNFYCRSEQSGESIAEYVAGLRRLALHCEFADFLDQALCDHFVCGLRSESTQKALLTETTRNLP